MVAFIQKAHGCIFFCCAIEAQAAQLAISDRLDWCVAAAQEQNGTGTSILNIGASDPALRQDTEFLDWCDQRIQITLGAVPSAITGYTSGGGRRDLHLVQHVTTNMGRSFLAGVKAPAPTISSTS